MNYTIVKALIYKESLQIIRDPSTILIAFVLPLVLLFVFGVGVNLDSNRINIGLVLEDTNPTVGSLTRDFEDTRFLETHIARDRRIFINDLIKGSMRGIVVVPQRFTANLLARPTTNIQIIADGSEPNTAAFVEGYAQGVITGWVNGQAFENGKALSISGINLESRYWFNPTLKSRNFLIPGSIAIIMILIGTLLTALVIAREWERGTMEAMLATPITIFEILLGKLVPYFVLGICSMLLCTFIAIFVYQIPFQGSLLVLIFSTSVFLIAALGQGLLISTVSKDQFIAAQMALISAFLPAFILSGFIFDISAMPAPIRWLTHIFAVRYFVTILQTIFITGNIWSLFLHNIFYMAIIGFIFLILIAAKTSKRLD